MMFLGRNFTSYKHSLSATPTHIDGIKFIKISKAVFDEIYGTRKILETWDGHIPDISEWDFDTIIHSLFQNTLYAGNVSFTSANVTSMRIKKRKKGEFIWQTLFEIAINEDEDFQFEVIDRYCRANTEYEYAFVPTLNGVEGNINMNSIDSQFEGIYLVEKDVMYQALVNTTLQQELNQDAAYVQTIGRKYPYYIANGDSKYKTFQLKSSFINIDDCELDVENGWIYREQIDEFLANNRTKIMKTEEGQLFMVCIVDGIIQDNSQHEQMPIHSVKLVEVGNAESANDLYDNNFIDTQIDIRR